MEKFIDDMKKSTERQVLIHILVFEGKVKLILTDLRETEIIGVLESG